jgi:hypothetical protein
VITFGNNIYISVSTRGKIAYSNDGITWTGVIESIFKDDSSAPDMGDIYGICYGNNKFVAVGYRGKIAYSSDGILWIEINNTPFDEYISDICYANNQFIAVTAGGKIAYSNDGILWTAASTIAVFENVSVFDSIYVRFIEFVGDRFIIESNGQMFYSFDGILWKPFNDTIFERNQDWVSGVAYGNNIFVAAGGDAEWRSKIAFSK